MKVVVILSNLIIGEHIRCLLNKNGYETLDRVYTSEDATQILLHRDSDYFIVNDGNVKLISELIEKSSEKTEKGKIINLKNSSVFDNEEKKENKNDTTIIENPFMNYEVISALM